MPTATALTNTDKSRMKTSAVQTIVMFRPRCRFAIRSVLQYSRTPRHARVGICVLAPQVTHKESNLIMLNATYGHSCDSAKTIACCMEELHVPTLQPTALCGGT
jgi:hypothetical protein